jgi:hypothetical protein
MFPSLTDDQRHAINHHGTPLPLFDEAAHSAYMLMGVEFISDPKESGFTARIPGIDAYGEGETEQEAALALQEALRSYLNAFG